MSETGEVEGSAAGTTNCTSASVASLGAGVTDTGVMNALPKFSQTWVAAGNPVAGSGRRLTVRVTVSPALAGPAGLTAAPTPAAAELSNALTITGGAVSNCRTM